MIVISSKLVTVPVGVIFINATDIVITPSCMGNTKILHVCTYTHVALYGTYVSTIILTTNKKQSN